MGDFGQGVQGAAGGAAAGTAILPGWGTAIGAGIGFLGGYFSDNPMDQYRDQLNKLAQGYGDRTAPQAQYSGFRSNQAGLIAQLEAMARGEGPSAAQAQMKDAMTRAGAQQQSLAAGAGGRGVNAGAALRNAGNNVAAIQTQGARDSSILRAQEQLAAVQQLGSNISAGRSADEGINTANMQSALQVMGLNQQQQLGALYAAMGVAPPPMGTSILAAGASAAPGITAAMQARKGNGAPNYNDPTQYWQGSKRQGSMYGDGGPAPQGGNADGWRGVRMPDGSLYGG